MFLKSFALGAAALFVAGCTSYQSGVGSHWRGRDVLVVSGAGNGFTSAQRVNDYVFLQASEAALKTGYKYFIMVDSQNTSTTTYSTWNSPTTTTMSGYTYGNYFSGTATTTGGPQTIPVFKPGMDAAFKMFKDRPKGYQSNQYWSAGSIYHELGPKYLGSKYNPKLGRQPSRRQRSQS
jgi:hypothetical protein